MFKLTLKNQEVFSKNTDLGDFCKNKKLTQWDVNIKARAGRALLIVLETFKFAILQQNKKKCIITLK